MSDASLYLMQGTKVLSKGSLKVNHSLLVRDQGPANFTCKMLVRDVVKKTSKNISVVGELLCCVFIIAKGSFY